MGFRTQAQVDRLKAPAGKADSYVWDHEQPGLSVRLKGGKRTWTVWYAVGGRRRKVTIGAVTGLPLREARQKAGRIVADARDGKDPLVERATAKAKAADTFGALVKLYLERRAKPRQRPRTYAEAERHLLNHWALLHDRAVVSVTRRDITARLEEIVRDHGPIAANRARTYLNGCYSWAMRQGLVENNPIVGTEAPSAENKRDRVLSPPELAVVWRACEERGEFGAVVRLLMLTGARREEVAALSWPELDLDKALWVLPAARSKNRREHEVPLSRQAVALIDTRGQVLAKPGTTEDEVRRRREQRPYLFGRGGLNPFSGYSAAKAKLDQAVAMLRAKRAGDAPKKVELEKWMLPSWTLHDLRRSAVTHMAEIGIEPHVIEAAINHVSGHRAGVAGIYNRATYREQKRVALQAWADWLESLVEGRAPASNVVAMRA
jgi:integrase